MCTARKFAILPCSVSLRIKNHYIVYVSLNIHTIIPQLPLSTNGSRSRRKNGRYLLHGSFECTVCEKIYALSGFVRVTTFKINWQDVSSFTSFAPETSVAIVVERLHFF